MKANRSPFLGLSIVSLFTLISTANAATLSVSCIKDFKNGTRLTVLGSTRDDDNSQARLKVFYRNKKGAVLTNTDYVAQAIFEAEGFGMTTLNHSLQLVHPDLLPGSIKYNGKLTIQNPEMINSMFNVFSMDQIKLPADTSPEDTYLSAITVDLNSCKVTKK